MEVTTQTKENKGYSSRRFIRQGIAGNYDIVFEMIRVIRDSVYNDAALDNFVVGLLRGEKLDSYSNPLEQLDTIYKFVKLNVAYINDPAGLVESVKSARVTLADGYGDCDDLTNTVATLAGVIGFENVKIALAKYNNEATFSHVYPVVYTADGQRVAMDVSLPNGKLGDEIRATEVKEISVFDNVQGLDGVSGLYNNARYHTKKLARAAIETIPVAAGYLPLGFFSSEALATGAQLINKSGSSELSLNATASKINQQLDKIIISLIRSQMSLDMAKSNALQLASQLSAVKDRKMNLETYNIIKASIQSRLEFINNFEAYAKANDIKVVSLNATAMLALGVGAAGFGAYSLIKRYYNKRGQ